MLDPAHLNARRRLGRLLAMSGDYRGADQHYKAVLGSGKADMDTVNEVLAAMKDAPARFAESRGTADQVHYSSVV